MPLFSSIRFRLHAKKWKYIFNRNRYVVLLPEVPDDSPENNPLLRNNLFPPFSEITTQHCINAVGKFVVEHDSGIHELQERLQDSALPKNVENVITPLDQLAAPVETAFTTLKVLHAVKHDDFIADVYMKLHSRMMKSKRERYLYPPIYRAFKEMKVDEKRYTTPVQRVINKYILEAQLSGVDLSGDKLKHFQNALVKLEGHKSSFREKLRYCTNSFMHMLTSDNAVYDLPRELLCDMAIDPANYSRGPWKLTLSPHIYKPFMEYCGDRLLRWNLWRANVIKASTSSGVHLDNSLNVEEIRFARHDLANLLGLKNFVELSMKTKMAGSYENVMSMINTLHTKSKDTTKEELEELQTFATENGFEHKLELWDVPYWQRRHKEELFGLDEASVRQYFPLPTVLKGLFNFCEMLFGIKIQEVTGVEKWHEDVSCYHIYDRNDKYVASFYLDPYARPGSKLKGAWMEVGRSKCEAVGSDPLSYLILSFPPPESGKPSLLSFSDLHILLQKFGHILQHSLTTVPYSDVAGLTNLEWDVVNVVPHVMSHWLQHYGTVSQMSGHVDTGDPLPKDIHEKLHQAHQYMAGLHLSEQLYLSAVDLEIYNRRTFWYRIIKELWARYRYFPFEKYQTHICSFSEIITDEYPAAYFSFMWSEMIAADIFTAFEEVGLDNKEAIKEVGNRFLDTYLSLGGGCHPSEVFRKFRGRDPSTEALLCSYGLTHKQQ